MFKDLKNILFKNSSKIIKFELWFKLFTILIAIPLFINSFNLIMHLTGYNYLTIENFIPFITDPLSIFMIILLILIIGFYSIFDIGVIIILYDASIQNKKIALKDAIYLSLKKSLKVFFPTNIGLLILILFLSPFLNLGIGSSVISSISVPEFILDFIEDNLALNILYFIFIVILFMLSLRLLYSLHYYFLEDKSFIASAKSSNHLSKHQHIKDLLKLVLVQLFIILLYLLLIFFGIFIVMFIHEKLNNIIILESVIISLITVLILLSLIIISIVNTALNYVCLTILFYRHKKSIDEEIIHIDVKEVSKNISKSRFRKVKIILATLSFVILTCFTYGVINGSFSLNIEYIRHTEVTAHRGASSEYPENTFASFIGAKNLGANWIELDVQQTKDHQIIVSHDKNLKRVTGVNLNIWEATYEEIKELDAGAYMGSQFKGESIPLLKDVIIWAKENNMKLNIELKPNGHEENFEKEVIDIINKEDFVDYCVVTSQVLDVLKNIKKIDEFITTVYVMSLAIGDITTIDYADYYSIEASSITREMVTKVHKEGKLIYAWTVNTEESINKMIELNVDNIITDDITLARNLVDESRTSNIIIELVNLIESIFG